MCSGWDHGERWWTLCFSRLYTFSHFFTGTSEEVFVLSLNDKPNQPHSSINPGISTLTHPLSMNFDPFEHQAWVRIFTVELHTYPCRCRTLLRKLLQSCISGPWCGRRAASGRSSHWAAGRTPCSSRSHPKPRTLPPRTAGPRRCTCTPWGTGTPAVRQHQRDTHVQVE